MRKQLLLLLGLVVVAAAGLACDRDDRYVRERYEHRRSYRSCDDGPRYESRSYRSHRRSRHGHVSRRHVERRVRRHHD